MLLLYKIMATFTGRVIQLEVEDKAKTARVQIDPPGTTTPPDTFKVTNDDDSSYGAMVSNLALARVVGINVTIEHKGDKEINKLTF